jgi:hypothetical protein
MYILIVVIGTNLVMPTRSVNGKIGENCAPNQNVLNLWFLPGTLGSAVERSPTIYLLVAMMKRRSWCLLSLSGSPRSR